MRNVGHILVVDDDDATLSLLVDVLAPEGYSVQACRDGVSALQSIKHQQPALILLDLVMPQKSGLHVLQDVRRRGLHDMPVVLITASPCTAEYVQSQGATDYLEKPFELDELLDCVARHMPRQPSDEQPLLAYSVGETRSLPQVAC